MPSIWNWLSRRSGKSTNSSSKRALAKSRPALECLETRQVLNAGGIGGLHSFAVLNGQIAGTGQPTVVKFQIQPTRTYSDAPIPVLLGFQVSPANGSNVVPKIVGIRSLSSRSMHSVQTKGGSLFASAMIPLSAPATYAVQVKGVAGTTGPFQVSVFLPGDVNGDGRVDRVDLANVRAAYGSREGGPRYLAAADFGRTGKVGLVDLGVTRRNLGSTLSITGLNQFPQTLPQYGLTEPPGSAQSFSSNESSETSESSIESLEPTSATPLQLPPPMTTAPTESSVFTVPTSHESSESRKRSPG